MKYNVLQYLEAAIIESPDKAAYVDEHRSFTFSEVKIAAFKLADHIYDPKLSNQPIAVVASKNTLSLVAFLGIGYTGNFYTPIDAKYPEERLRIVLNDLSSQIIIVDNSSHDTVVKLDLPNVKIINIQRVLESNRLSDFDYTKVIYSKIDTDPVYCIYTSGSTGIPKGVVIPHRAVIDYLEYAVPTFKMDADTIIGNQAQLHFDLSVLDVFGPLKSLGTTVFIPESFFTFTAKLLPFLSEYKINFLCWAPAVLSYLASSKVLDSEVKIDLNYVLFCGEALPVSALGYWRSHHPKAVFVNLYGPTETTLSSTHYFIEKNFGADESIPIGIQDQNTEVFLADLENGVGEICIRGSSLALGYWRDEKKTSEKFCQNPNHNNYPERIYRTGDLAKYSEIGELLYVGRKDNQIKHMGYRIELEEVERAINQCEGIDQSYVFYDQGKKEIVCAYQAVSEVNMKKELKSILPAYMIPARHVRYDKIPLNNRGKIDREFIKSVYYGKN